MNVTRAYLSRSNHSRHCSTLFSLCPQTLLLETLARIRLCVHLYIFSFSLSTISIIYYDVKHTSKMISYREIILHFHYWNERRAYQRNNLEGVENEDKNQMWGQGGKVRWFPRF